MNKNPKTEPKKIGRPRKEKQNPKTFADGGLVKGLDGSIDPVSETIVPLETFTIKPEFRYEKHILKLQTMQGFYDEWISRLAYSKDNKEAYESAEAFFIAYFDRRRFKDYDSFRSRLSQWLKEERGK